MSLTKLTENLNNVSSLPDKPSIQSEELKKVFDAAGNIIKEYLNTILTEEIEKDITELTNKITTNIQNIQTANADIGAVNEAIEKQNANIDTKAPKSHASSDTTYGVGTTSNYGHCKVANDLNNSSFTDSGLVLSAYQGYVLKNLIEALANTLSNTETSLADYINRVKDDLNRFINSVSNKFENGFTIPYGGITANGDFYTENYNFHTVFGDIYTDQGAISAKDGDVKAGKFLKSDAMYDESNVTNAPNTYVTSNGWLRRTTGSSKRYKTDITEEIENRLNPEALLDLPIKQFKYKEGCISETDVRYGKNILGFIAEDVADIYEPAVQYDEKGQVEMWNAQVMIPAMLKLIQEQNKRIKELEEKVLS